MDGTKYESEKKPTSLANSYFISAKFRMSIAKCLMINTWYKYYNERIATHGNVNIQSHDQEESAFNSTIITNCGAHLTWG